MTITIATPVQGNQQTVRASSKHLLHIDAPTVAVIESTPHRLRKNQRPEFKALPLMTAFVLKPHVFGMKVSNRTYLEMRMKKGSTQVENVELKKAGASLVVEPAAWSMDMDTSNVRVELLPAKAVSKATKKVIRAAADVKKAELAAAAAKMKLDAAARRLDAAKTPVAKKAKPMPKLESTEV